MATMLMATWDGAGNFPPERALVRQLVGRGHRVTVLAHDQQQAQVEADGASFVPYAGVMQVDATDPEIDTKAFNEVVFAAGIGTSLAAAIAKLRPNALLIDAFLSTALTAAAASGLPVAALGSTLHGFMRATPMGAQAEAADLALIFSDRAFEPDADIPANVVHVGPLRPRTCNAGSWPRRHPDRPLVVTSLSTSYQNQHDVLQRLCDALGSLDVEAIVTTGRAIDPAALSVASNITLVRHVPHEQVLPQTSLLITHAGHGTVIAGATFGVPLLCLPMGRDQPLVAERAAALGLATVVEPSVSVGQMRSAIVDRLADSVMAARARAYADRAADERHDDRAVELIESLLHGR